MVAAFATFTLNAAVARPPNRRPPRAATGRRAATSFVEERTALSAPRTWGSHAYAMRLPPLLRQLRDDRLGLAAAAQSGRSATLAPRTQTADRVVPSVCPFCAVGCAQNVYVKDEQVVHIEGDKDSPISRGRLCPRGSSSLSLVTSPSRVTTVRYRRPHAAEWEDLDLDTALDMIADRVIDTRRRTWQERDGDGNLLRRTLGFAHLGGATLDIEENYLIKKGFSALGAVAIENQARI
jgi:formate dehydrogenase major subunit